MNWVFVLLAAVAVGTAFGVGHAGFLTNPMKMVRMMHSGRERLRSLLERVERETAPDYVMGAMCYSTVAPPDRVEYICPVCGERTFYGQSEVARIQWELPAMRRIVEEWRGNGFFEASIEETYCSNCNPADSTGETRLVIAYSEGDTVRVAVGMTDLQMLTGLLHGELSYETSNESIAPLKGNTERLRAILGIE